MKSKNLPAELRAGDLVAVSGKRALFLIEWGRAWLARTLFCAAFFVGAASASSQSTAVRTPSPAVAAGKESLPPDQWHERLKDDNLSSEEIAAATALALGAQADDTTNWDTRWGDFVGLARTKGKLSDDLWRDYLLAAVRVKIRVATQTKRSAGLPILIDQQAARTGRNGPPARAVGIREDDLSGIPLKPGSAGQKESMNLRSGGGSGLGWIEDLTQERYSPLKPGPQTYHYRYEVKITGARGANGNPPETIGERVIEGTIPWRLLAEDEARSLPALRPDPALRPALEKAFSSHYILRDKRDKTLAEAMIQVDHPPVGMAFDMSLRAGGEIWPLGPVAWVKDKIGWWAFATDLPEEIHHVDVVLTPSARAAARLAEDADRYRVMDLDTIWDGPEIVIPGVEVRSQRIQMIKVRPVTKQAAREYALAQMDPSDPVAQQWKIDGDTSRAQAALEQRTKEHPGDAMANYELGCLLTADGSLTGAMKYFVEAQRVEPATALRRQIQRQQRRLCAMWLHLAEAGDAAAMGTLGTAYEHGWGVGSDIQEAKRWSRNASNAGNADAMCRLAAMYEHKTGATVQTDKADQWYRAQALEWYRKAAGLGNEEAKQWILSNDH